MASPAFQAKLRLSFAIALGIILLGSCARALRDEKDFEPLPDEASAPLKKTEIPVAGAESKEVKPPQDTKTKKKKKPKKKKAMSKVADRAPGFQATHWPFGIGEQLHLELKYGVLDAGEARLMLVDAQEMEGEKLLHLRGEIVSSSVVNLFYKVNNSIDCFLSLDNFIPFRQVIRQNESKRWGQSLLTFDYEKKTAHYYSNFEIPNKPKEHIDKTTEPVLYAQDLFGALYFYRFLEIEKSLKFPVHDKFKDWQADMTFVEREELEVDAGKFKTIHLKVLPKMEGALKPQADVDVWLSDDPRKLLVQFKSKLKFGSLSGELTKYVAGQEILVPPPKLLTPFEESK